jgi:chorismate-pyruvate lyase
VTQQIPAPDLETLLSLFYQDIAQFGTIAATPADAMPAVARKLLDHEHHMTVTVEDYHNCEVDVQVLETLFDGQAYSRKILLTKQTDSTVVQFGIVRLHFEFLATHVQQEIMAEETPLGRILINHNVLRRVELSQLWKIQVGQDLAELFRITPDTIVYGRTAWIYCNGEPAIELLEVVTPAP